MLHECCAVLKTNFWFRSRHESSARAREADRGADVFVRPLLLRDGLIYKRHKFASLRLIVVLNFKATFAFLFAPQLVRVQVREGKVLIFFVKSKVVCESL
jgi:hypothetical protein